MRGRSRSTLFLMEQLVVILVLAVCASACVSIFVDSYFIARDARDLKTAVLTAENGAECYKAAGGDIQKTAVFLSAGGAEPNGLTVFYNSEWSLCGADDAMYSMVISRGSDTADVISAGLTVSRIAGDKPGELVSLALAAREVGR